MCVHVCLHIGVSMHVCVHELCRRESAFVTMSVWGCVHVYVIMCASMHIGVWVCMCIIVYIVCMHIGVSMHMCVIVCVGV